MWNGLRFGARLPVAIRMKQRHTFQHRCCCCYCCCVQRSLYYTSWGRTALNLCKRFGIDIPHQPTLLQAHTHTLSTSRSKTEQEKQKLNNQFVFFSRFLAAVLCVERPNLREKNETIAKKCVIWMPTLIWFLQLVINTVRLMIRWIDLFSAMLKNASSQVVKYRCVVEWSLFSVPMVHCSISWNFALFLWHFVVVVANILSTTVVAAVVAPMMLTNTNPYTLKAFRIVLNFLNR